MFKVLDADKNVLFTSYYEGRSRRFIEGNPIESTYLELPNGVIEEL